MIRLLRLSLPTFVLACKILPSSAKFLSAASDYTASLEEQSSNFQNVHVNDVVDGTVSLDAFSPIGMQQYELEFPDTNLSLTLLQSYLAYDETGEDDTGLVLWGASVAHSRFLLLNDEHNMIPRGGTIMELGCGSALPSLVVACLLGPSRVIATDFRPTTLAHAQYHAAINRGCGRQGDGVTERRARPIAIETYRVDWEDGASQEQLIQQQTVVPDVILAADAVYDASSVPALVQTLKRLLPRHGKLILATRDGRNGIPELLNQLKTNFEQIHFEAHGEDEPSYMPEIPTALENDIHSVGRYNGNHSIYVYQWKKGTI